MKLKPGFKLLACVVLFSTALSIGNAGAYLIDFEGLVEGQIIDNEFAPLVTISAMDANKNRRPAVIFNSNTNRDLEDDDLMAPWSGGNIAGEDLGNLLIVQDDQRPQLDGTGNIAYPDDEGDRPAGSIFFNFASPVSSFGFDLIDVEGPDEYGTDSGYYAVFYSGNNASASIGFGTLALMDNSISYGDNTANRINSISFDQLGLTQFDRVEINFGGSAAVDNIRFNPVPEPASMLLVGSGLILLAGIGRKKFKKPGRLQ